MKVLAECFILDVPVSSLLLFFPAVLGHLKTTILVILFNVRKGVFSINSTFCKYLHGLDFVTLFLHCFSVVIVYKNAIFVMYGMACGIC